MNINLRSILPIAIAIILAAATAMLVRSWLHRTHHAETVAAQVAADKVEVAVAAHNMPAGTILGVKDLRWQNWPLSDVASDYIVNGRNGSLPSFQGAVIREGMVAGEPVTWTRAVKPGDRGDLAAMLSPGMRAISIRVTDISGVSGFVAPGDRIDLILSHRVTEMDAKDQPVVRQVSETILRDVRVLATDQKTSDQDTKPVLAKTITLEVTPKEAEEVTLAGSMADISLSLHSLANSNQDLAKIAATGPSGLLDMAPPSPGGSYTWDSQLSRVIPGLNGRTEQIIVDHGAKTEAVDIR